MVLRIKDGYMYISLFEDDLQKLTRNDIKNSNLMTDQIFMEVPEYDQFMELTEESKLDITTQPVEHVWKPFMNFGDNHVFVRNKNNDIKELRRSDNYNIWKE